LPPQRGSDDFVDLLPLAELLHGDQLVCFLRLSELVPACQNGCESGITMKGLEIAVLLDVHIGTQAMIDGIPEHRQSLISTAL
jgi:hypothetical protein